MSYMNILFVNIFILVHKYMIFGYHRMGTPTCLCKQEVEKPSHSAAQPCARVQGYVNDDLRADELWKGRGL